MNLSIDAVKARAIGLFGGVSLLTTVLFAAAIVQLTLQPIAKQLPFSRYLIPILALQGIAIPITIFLYTELTDNSLKIFPINRPQPAHVLIGISGGLGLFALATGLFTVADLLGLPAAPGTLTQATATALIFLGIASALVVAPLEELLFRGIIHQHFTKTFSTPTAVFLTSVLFALPHVGSITNSPGQMTTLVVLFVLGVVLTVVYERTQSLRYPILMHAVYNTATFVSVYLAGSGV